MMKRLLVAFFFWGSLARADILPLPVSAINGPQLLKENDSIAMAREDVRVELYDCYAIVDASFDMHSSANKTIEMDIGFPGEGTRIGGGFGVHAPLIRFSAWVDGKPANTQAKSPNADQSETWHVFPARFLANGTTKIRVRYGVVADPPLTSQGENTVFYILSTGAKWKGAIGEARISIIARNGVDAASLRMPAMRTQIDLYTSTKLPHYATRVATGIEILRKALKPTERDDLAIFYHSFNSCPTDPHGMTDLGKVTPHVEKTLVDTEGQAASAPSLEQKAGH
jgi:hypothetical protein